MSIRSACLCVALAAAATINVGGQTQAPSAITLLGRYADGQFNAVVSELTDQEDFARLLKDLKSHAEEWIAAGGQGDRARRELAAATFALEAARVDEWREWKWIQKPPRHGPAADALLEAAAAAHRVGLRVASARTKRPRPIERTWQLAAMAVAQRSEDTQFLIGFTQLAPDAGPRRPSRPGAPPSIPGLPRIRVQPRPQGIEVLNVQDEIGHLNHTMDRFPAEKRFVLGQAIARERDFPVTRSRSTTCSPTDPDVGGEALMRLGALQVRQGRVADALVSFERAERLTRDADVIYLARRVPRAGAASLEARGRRGGGVPRRAGRAARHGNGDRSCSLNCCSRPAIARKRSR